MLWIALALGTAFFSASEAALIRHGFKDLSMGAATAAPLVCSLPLFLITLPFIKAPLLQPGFWSTLALMVPVHALGYFLQNSAFKSSPLGLTVPFMALTPVFVLLTGFLLLGEQPTVAGATGVFITVIGSYVLNLDSATGLLGPFKAILRERGSVLMLGSALVWSVAAALGKKMILLSSPFYAGCIFFPIHNIFLVLTLYALRQFSWNDLRLRPRHTLGVGLILYVHIIFHFLAVSMTAVAYLVSIKRLNGLIALGYDTVIFKQTLSRQRLAGTALMTAGAITIAILG